MRILTSYTYLHTYGYLVPTYLHTYAYLLPRSTCICLPLTYRHLVTSIAYMRMLTSYLPLTYTDTYAYVLPTRVCLPLTYTCAGGARDGEVGRERERETSRTRVESTREGLYLNTPTHMWLPPT